MDGEERLRRQMAFFLEADKEKQITRQTYLADGTRRETDAEHAWHLALMCALFSEYAEEKIDVAKTMCMVLTHDLVEIDAGDTYAYDAAGNATKREREEKAADRLYGMLPADQEAYLRGLWEEFERADTPEARFAQALDKIQPILLNDASDGKAWTEHGVTLSQILARNEKTPEGSEALWAYADKLVLRNAKEGKIRKDEE